jgi:hypothetical protein
MRRHAASVPPHSEFPDICNIKFWSLNLIANRQRKSSPEETGADSEAGLQLGQAQSRLRKQAAAEIQKQFLICNKAASLLGSCYKQCLIGRAAGVPRGSNSVSQSERVPE